MKFKAEYRSYTARYIGGVGSVVVVIWGIFIGSLLYEFSFSDFMNKIFSSDMTSILYFFSFTLVFQITGYFSTNKHVKLLTLDQSSLTFDFFNKTSLTLQYSDIKSLERTKDIFKHFVFTLNSGEQKTIYATLSDNEKAFEEITKRLS